MEKYISTCMAAGRMQEYLAREAEILGNLDRFITDKQISHKVDKKNKTITAEALVTVNQPVINGMFVQASGGGDGDGAYMVWIFAAKQATFTAEGDVTTYDPTVEQNSSSRNLDSSEIVKRPGRYNRGRSHFDRKQLGAVPALVRQPSAARNEQL